MPWVLQGATFSASDPGTDRRAASCGGAGSPDRAYRYVAPSDGLYVITLDPRFDAVLSASQEAGPELRCVDTPGWARERLVLDLGEGEAVVITVDGYEREGGAFALEISEAPLEACANGLDDDEDGRVDCPRPRMLAVSRLQHPVPRRDPGPPRKPRGPPHGGRYGSV